MWSDPPEYWEESELSACSFISHQTKFDDTVVWPAYIKAHKPLFEDGDVVKGKLNPNSKVAKDMLLFEASERTMADLVQESCERIWNRANT